MKKMPSKRGFKELACTCGETVKVDANCGGVTCPTCVQKIAAPPDCLAPVKEKKEKEPKEIKEVGLIQTGKHKGFPLCFWLKKEFVGPDGILYRKGKPVEKKNEN